MTRKALVANVLTLLAIPIPSAAAPPVPAAVPEPAEVAPPTSATVLGGHSAAPEIGLAALQLVTGYLVGIGGTALLVEAKVYPEDLSRSDTAAWAYLGVLAPTLTTAAVCGTGYLSSRYRGRCWTTLLGAYAGAALGLVVGALLAPGPGETDLDTTAIYAMLGGALFTPVGAVAGWHLGKQEIARPATLTAQQSRNNVMLPVLSLRW